MFDVNQLIVPLPTLDLWRRASMVTGETQQNTVPHTLAPMCSP